MRDMNAIKAATRQGMGHCGGYQCTNAVEKLLGFKSQKTRPGME